MGVCASCLGGGQPRDPVEQEQDEVESGPLLFSVPNGMHYGSFAEPQMMAPHSDPSRSQRETEALQRVVARTSDGLVDIYDTATPGAYSRHKHGSVRDRKAQYQILLTKVDSDDSLSTDEEDDAPLQGAFTQIKADSRRKLVGSFREAAAAMA
ncbi:hypothetical protein SLS64_001795 [Diaporthe eres]|uniref:Late endosomal/lysosomal adaptor and MAPK and MTOR activator domain-containing protein n=1 Tax=Diaporthe eres TaxID=83184 RepID=A0ABR1PP20_DIAER